MMSYLWILLLGSLLASHVKAQDDETVAPEPLDVTVDDGEVDNPATEPSASDTEPVTDFSEENDVATLAPLDSEESTPSDVEPIEGGEEDGVNDATEASVEGDPETTTLAADPEPNVPADAETTPAPELEPLPEGGNTETESTTPGDALIVTTGTGEALTTQGAGSGDVEPEQTTQNVVEEVPAVTDAPAVLEETGGDEKTTPAPIDEETTPALLIPDTEVVIEANQGLKTESEFNLLDALDEGTAENSQTKKGRTSSFNAEPVKEGDKTSTQEGSSKPLAAVLSAIVVSAVGAVTGYFAYQKKKLCFKNRGGADPETGPNTDKADVAEAQSDPQVLSNLLPATQQ